MEQERTILEAAMAIRPYLQQLLGAEADAFDHNLAELLSRNRDGEDVEGLLAAHLRKQRATHNWTAAFLEHGRPPEMIAVATERGGFSDLPGHGEPSRADKFACPLGDYVWYRRAVGQKVPPCPTHGELALVEDDR